VPRVPERPDRYQVNVDFSNSTPVVPNSIGMQINDVSMSASVSLSFSNILIRASAGGPSQSCIPL
jgi:hypothetical protein